MNDNTEINQADWPTFVLASMVMQEIFASWRWMVLPTTGTAVLMSILFFDFFILNRNECRRYRTLGYIREDSTVKENWRYKFCVSSNKMHVGFVTFHYFIHSFTLCNNIEKNSHFPWWCPHEKCPYNLRANNNSLIEYCWLFDESFSAWS